ncbi:5-hydroxytryptamine receptor 7 [Tyrophagus putrescentiae]|nr:5-hydroxytryptamine receptor 7 [Tyrophagus putrescentiae]
MTSSSSSSFINDSSSTSTTSTPPSPAAIDTLLGSLPLASLQLLKFCCAAVGRHLLHHHPQTNSGGDEGESGDDDGSKMVTSYSSSFSSSFSSSSSSSSPPSAVDCLWPTNPALLCDRFHLLHLAANLTASSSVEDYLSRSGGNEEMELSSFSDFVQDDQTSSYLSPNIRIMLTILLTLMIISTVIGNILVCLSVILVRKLRHPSNYLLRKEKKKNPSRIMLRNFELDQNEQLPGKKGKIVSFVSFEELNASQRVTVSDSN